MGVDFSTCDSCDEVFCECGPYAVCEDCGSYLCESCREEFEVGHNMSADSEHVEDVCPFCSKEVVTDRELLAFALVELSTSRHDLEQEYRSN